MNNANGSVFKYPDNVDTDVIIPARYLNTPNAKELAAHCMEDIDKDFINKVKEGDIVAAGQTLGKVGSVGCECAEEDHIHLEVKQGDAYLDPAKCRN